MFFIVSNSPELLYHIILTVIDYHLEPSGAKPSTYLLGTRAALETAEDSSLGSYHPGAVNVADLPALGVGCA
ncbi:Uncharacterized protein HZ326_26532 [Fusarium oxysporum f. sp. albedinis]|nr:Uncharacterized protein HZ326_26532 [Fusarium oxysporum f. sp. albedinis]